MATSIFSNLLYNTSSSNDLDARDNNNNNSLSDDERQQIVSLLQASAKCVENGSCDPVIYQTMGALHQYTALHSGLLSSSSASKPIATSSSFQQPQRPAFQDNSTSLEASDHKDALAYGWVEELSASETPLSSADDVAWNSVLALLVQEEEDDEPCFWITKEVLANQGEDEDLDDECEDRDETNNKIRGPQAATELETLHSIPLRRRLRSCRYQNFYGDHRVVLELKRFGRNIIRHSSRKTKKNTQSQIVLRCPSARAAKAWVDCLAKAKKRKPKMDATHANIEVEMVDPSPSNEFGESTDDDGVGSSSSSRHRRRHRIVNVIDSEDDEEEDYGIPNQELPKSPKRLAEVLQETEDRKKAIKLAVQQAEALERAQEEEEKLEKERKELERQEEERQMAQAAKLEAEKREQEKLAAIARQQKEAQERKKQEEAQRQRLAAIEKNVETIAKATANNTTPAPPSKPTKPKPMTAAEKQQQRMEREIAARKRAEEERRRIEIEYEQQKKERVEQRRRDLEAKRKLAREEQKRKEQLQKQRFLESEQRKEAMKAAAMKAPPKKVVKGVFSAPATSAARDASKNEKGNLWFSLNKHMSAFETADEERKKREAEKLAAEKAKAEAEKEEEDPEVVRKRIAEEARQRLVQEEVGKKTKEAEASKMNGNFRLPEGWNSPKKPTSPHASLSPTTSQTNLMGHQNGWQKHQGSTSPQASISPASSQHNRTGHASVSPPVSGNYSHKNPAPNPVPLVPPLRHPHTQSWNKMQQPPYPQQTQQAQFQRPPPASVGPYPPTAQGYRSQPSAQPTPSAFDPMHQQSRNIPKAQPKAAAPQPTPPVPPQPAAAPAAPNEEFSGSELKKSVLIQWGLQPPSMQVLKPVDQLLCSIHGVFPPSFGVPSHEYFQGWKAISRAELITNGVLEESKLKKSVRKVRFFLHPDKLPHDLTEEQSFLCKLLWDVINDAFEEYKKSKEDLDWM